MLLLAQIHTQYKENTEALLVASNDIGLKVYAERATQICSYVINRMQDKITTYRQVIDALKVGQCSDILKA